MFGKAIKKFLNRVGDFLGIKTKEYEQNESSTKNDDDKSETIGNVTVEGIKTASSLGLLSQTLSIITKSISAADEVIKRLRDYGTTKIDNAPPKESMSYQNFVESLPAEMLCDNIPQLAVLTNTVYKQAQNVGASISRIKTATNKPSDLTQELANISNSVAESSRIFAESTLATIREIHHIGCEVSTNDPKTQELLKQSKKSAVEIENRVIATLNPLTLVGQTSKFFDTTTKFLEKQIHNKYSTSSQDDQSLPQRTDELLRGIESDVRQFSKELEKESEYVASYCKKSLTSGLGFFQTLINNSHSQGEGKVRGR